MATAPVLPTTRPVSFDVTSQSDRQAMIDSVLGTMGAEGEPPSVEAQSIMKQFVLGEISLTEMSDAVLEHASRMVHEANAARLAVR